MNLTPQRVTKAVLRRIGKAIHRRRFAASVRPSDVFLVTYPKSGTVWLSLLVANVLKGSSDEQLDINSWVKYVPDINEQYFKHGTLHTYDALASPRIFSVHAPYDRCLKRAVYMMRDPRDVAVSYWHFRRLTEVDFTLSLGEFIATDEQWPGRWEDHVSGWLRRQHSHDLLLLRYEDLQRDTGGTLKRVLEFCGVDYTVAQIERAVEASSFEALQAMESKVRFAEAVRPGRFVRRGKIGGWMEEIDAASLRILERKAAAVMEAAGYARATTE